MAVEVFVERCRSYKEGELDKAIFPILQRLTPKLGTRPKILLKPNILRPAKPNEAITTHPEFVNSVAKFYRRAYPRAQIFIGESSGCLGLPNTKRALAGYSKAIRNHRLKVVPFESQKIAKVKNPHGKIWKEVPLPKVLLDADIVVNLPKLKTHTLTVFTGAVKNFYGCVPGAIKGKGHADAISPAKFSSLVLDVFQAVKCQVHLMDAVVGMEGNGPSNGLPKQTGYILGSKNGVALDAAALRLAAIPETNVPTQVEAASRKLLPGYKIVGELKPVPYKFPSLKKWALLGFLPETMLKFLGTKLSPFPVNHPFFVHSKCTRCYACKKICPVGAIYLKGKFPEVNRKLCINCLCCAEQCPYGAIETKGSLLLRLLKMR